MTSRERRILIVTALFATGVPASAAWWVNARTQQLASRLGEAGGVPARIGTLDADLSGAIRLTDVAFGDLISADAIEASVGMGSLLDGELRADEIRIEGPRVSVHVDGDGDSDLARLARRLAHGQRHTGAGGARIRRIVVAGGTLTAQVAGIGELSADGVELVPDAGGVRVVTGLVRVHGSTPIPGFRGVGPGPASDRRLGVELAFARSAAEISLPQMRFGRVLAVGGAGTITGASGVTGVVSQEAAVVLRDLAAGRRVPGGALEIRGAIDDAGIARAISVDVSPVDFAVTLQGDHVPLRMFGSLVPHGLDVADTRATGTVTLRLAAQTLALEANGNVDHLVIDHRAVATEAVTLAAAVRASVTITPETITVARASLQLGAIELSAGGWMRRGTPTSGQLDVQLAPAPCSALLASLPEAVRGPLDGMALDGSLGGRARLVVDLAAPVGEGVTLSSSLATRCEVTSEPPGGDVTVLADASEQQLADGSHARIGHGEPDWAPLRGLPAHVAGAFVSAEDAQFWGHAGFDLHQIARSLEIDLREHRLARGGSTISQQLVKNAFLSQRRSFDRKLQEAVLTWRLEARLDKKQILERYLNIIELGPRTFGLAAAARYWFDTSPRHLTVRQAAFLAALTSQPASMSRRVRHAGGLDPETAERVTIVLRAMLRDGAIGPEAYDAAKAASLHFTPTAIAGER
ncbi:MAG: glycosyl transferase family 51 [Deltaproteobacteria bacterium]|nr:glycosyl transferase family 51 [Deltaproteobacteria bacterium]